MKTPTYIQIHHSASLREKNPDQFVANNEYHRVKWNFLSSMGFYLGYNYEISAVGKIKQARKDGEVTAACYQSWTRDFIPRWTGNMNDGRCLHICLDGNFDTEKPTSEQIYALRDWLKLKTKQYNISKENIYFHRDFAVKSCPGNNLDREWVRNLIYR